MVSICVVDKFLMFLDYWDVMQVKSFYVGGDFVGDVPLSKKILAALTTGEC